MWRHHGQWLDTVDRLEECITVGIAEGIQWLHDRFDDRSDSGRLVGPQGWEGGPV